MSLKKSSFNFNEPRKKLGSVNRLGSFYMPSSGSIQEVIVCMLEYFLQCYPKDCTRSPLQRTNLLHIRLELRDQNYQTPFYADCILKCLENRHKIYFLVDNSCNFEVISKSNTLKQI
jgi:BarA-like signal transduction histidine kinase